MKQKRIKTIILLTIIGTVISVAFGIWHFFVPSVWNWYSYILPDATELVIAVRAINIFFSLLLVMLGVANVLSVLNISKGKFQTIIIISISALLWLARVILQVIYPQGSRNPVIQYGMLLVFIIVFVCFAITLFLLLKTTDCSEEAGTDEN